MTAFFNCASDTIVNGVGLGLTPTLLAITAATVAVAVMAMAIALCVRSRFIARELLQKNQLLREEVAQRTRDRTKP